MTVLARGGLRFSPGVGRGRGPHLFFFHGGGAWHPLLSIAIPLVTVLLLSLSARNRGSGRRPGGPRSGGRGPWDDRGPSRRPPPERTGWPGARRGGMSKDPSGRLDVDRDLEERSGTDRR